jgi:phosphoadenosine phosphosulfate reductase
MSTPVFPAERVAAANRLLEGASAQRVLRWAVEQFHPRLTMATAFGAEGCCILHMLADIEPGVRVFNLDTGYQFPETLELRERIRQRYGIEVELVRPDRTVAEYEAMHGGSLHGRRPDQCCHDRKVVPLRRAVVGYDAWVSAIRRDQTLDRGQADVVQWDARFGLVKVNPLLRWSRRDVGNAARRRARQVPCFDDGRGRSAPGLDRSRRGVASGRDAHAARGRETAATGCSTFYAPAW